MLHQKNSNISEDFLVIFYNMMNILRKIHTDLKDNEADCRYMKITRNQLHILAFIKFLGGKCTNIQLQNETFLSKSSLSILLSKLEEQGYVKRKYPSAKDDKRYIYFSLTNIAEQELSKGTQLFVEKIEERFKNSSDEERQEVYKSIECIKKFLKWEEKESENE